VVDLMLREDPRKRPQTAEEPKTLLDKFRRPSPAWEGDRVRGALVEFEGALLKSLPGKRGLLRVTDPAKIDRLLNNLTGLSGPRKAYGLWWNQGTSNLQVDQMRKLDDATWLIGRDPIPGFYLGGGGLRAFPGRPSGRGAGGVASMPGMEGTRPTSAPLKSRMSPQQFAAKWAASALKERAGA
jgi:hypothetical protein